LLKINAPYISGINAHKDWYKDIKCFHFRRRCQIEVQFESGAKIKFLESSFQSVISISNYQSVPWTHSFQKMHNTYMGKIHLKVEKWGLNKKIYLNFMKNCKVLLQCFTLGHFISTIMNTNHKVSYINENVLTWGTTL